jgi:uncharacterized membrane-anchored protein YitT (DUF2179 family)
VCYFIINEKYPLDMANVSLAIAVVTFLVGFVFGYKAKEWRIKWLRRRRNRLASKLVETQKKLEVIATL